MRSRDRAIGKRIPLGFGSRRCFPRDVPRGENASIEIFGKGKVAHRGSAYRSKKRYAMIAIIDYKIRGFWIFR